MNKFFQFILIVSVIAANAGNVLAVLEIVPKSEVKVSIDEMRHLTDELRRQATMVLPSNSYSVLTRDNIFMLLPPDEKEAECLAESCAVEIGRTIGAEYISQGSLSIFGGKLSLSIELYETMTGKLLGSIVTENRDVNGLLKTIREQSPALFANIKMSEPGFSARFTDSQDLKKKKQDNLDLTPKSEVQSTSHSPLATSQTSQSTTKTSTWVAISLDVLGAVALGFGIYQNVEKNKFYDNYKNPRNFDTREAHSAELQKAKDAEKSAIIFSGVGGVLLATGIAVHVWF